MSDLKRQIEADKREWERTQKVGGAITFSLAGAFIGYHFHGIGGGIYGVLIGATLGFLQPYVSYAVCVALLLAVWAGFYYGFSWLIDHFWNVRF